jgi:membrane protein implicated in regulation of membrane protease activity
MVRLIARGRIAWILAIILGVVLLIVGIASNNTFLIVVGAAFLIFGLIFLIMSLATKGQTD